MSYIIESVFGDLLDAKIDESQNLLGNRWLERGTFATIIGSSGVGKSVAATQGGILMAAGLPFFGIKPPNPPSPWELESDENANQSARSTLVEGTYIDARSKPERQMRQPLQGKKEK